MIIPNQSRIKNGVHRIETLFIFELSSIGCINFKNLCAHHQEKVLRIPKHLLSIFLMNLSQVLAKSKKNLIVLYCSLFSGDREQFIKISHEISHAWFGIIIGSLDWTEAWISEGFATFLEGFIHDEALKLVGEKQPRGVATLRSVLKYEALTEELDNTEVDLQMLQPMEGTSKVGFLKMHNLHTTL